MLYNLAIDDGYWYLATPYSKYPAGLECAFKHACDAAGELLKRGIHIYCPIAHTHPIAFNGGLDPFSHDIFMPLDAHMMKGAHGLLVVQMPGWDESKGIDMEIAEFRSQEKPVEFLGWPILNASDGVASFSTNDSISCISSFSAPTTMEVIQPDGTTLDLEPGETVTVDQDGFAWKAPSEEES